MVGGHKSESRLLGDKRKPNCPISIVKIYGNFMKKKEKKTTGKYYRGE